MNDMVSSATALRRASAELVAGFGVVALLLAAIGIYGVVASAFNARTYQIGLRMASI